MWNRNVSIIQTLFTLGIDPSSVSDAAIVSLTASACDYIDRVKTQLTYALCAAGVSVVLFGLAGRLW